MRTQREVAHEMSAIVSSKLALPTKIEKLVEIVNQVDIEYHGNINTQIDYLMVNYQFSMFIRDYADSIIEGLSK